VLPEKVDANERLRAAQERLGLSGEQRLPFLCECEDVTCRSIIRLAVAEYGEARTSADRCLCADGHAPAGRVVGSGDGYVIVEKQ
jgi:hypothetical protein